MSGFSLYSAVGGFLLGIVGVVFMGAAAVHAIWLAGVAMTVAVVYAMRDAVAHRQLFAVVVLGLFCCAVGVWRTDMYISALHAVDLSPYEEQVIAMDGVVVREPENRAASQQVYVRNSDGTFLVLAPLFSGIAYGDAVTVVGTLERPESFATELGRTFNYPGYLETRGVTHVVRYAEVTVTDTGGGWWLIRQLLWVKGEFMRSLEMVIAEPAVALGEGLLLGVKQAMPPELLTAFRQTGIIHIVVLSGYNVALVVEFIMLVLLYVLPYRARLIAGMAAIGCFALLVGLSATVVRACVMATFLLLAKVAGNTYHIVRGLTLAGVVMLLVNPLLLPYDVGFQLSFLATLGLIVLSPRIESWLSWFPQVFGSRSLLSATIATQIFVWPILLYQIGELSIVSVVVNVLVLPAVPVAMLLTFMTGLVSMISTVAALPVAALATVSLQYIMAVPLAFASVPFAVYVIPAFPFGVVVLVYTLYICIWYWYRETDIDEAVPPAVEMSESDTWLIESEEVVVERLARKNGS